MWFHVWFKFVLWLHIVALSDSSIWVDDCTKPPENGIVAIDLRKTLGCEAPEMAYDSEGKDVNVMVLKTETDFEEEAFTCNVYVSILATRCGFNGLTYMTQYLQNDIPHILSKYECEKLISVGQMVIFGQNLDRNGKDVFSFDYMISGSRNTNGNCPETEDFTFRDPVTKVENTYSGYTKSAIITGSIKKNRFSKNILTDRIYIGHHQSVPYSTGFYNNSKSTIVWNVKRETEISCKLKINKLYHGQSKRYEAKTEKKLNPTVFMVEEETVERHQHFALIAKREEMLCTDIKVYVTQISGIFLWENPDEGELKRSGLKWIGDSQEDAKTQILSILGYNIVKHGFATYLSFKRFAQEQCKLSNQILENRLSIINWHSQDVGSSARDQQIIKRGK